MAPLCEQVLPKCRRNAVQPPSPHPSSPRARHAVAQHWCPVGKGPDLLALAWPSAEPVTEAQELRLIDRRQDCHHRRLDDLVLQGSDAERPLPAIRLPTRWQRSIRSCLDARMEIREVLLEAFRVLGPCHLVDAGGTSRPSTLAVLRLITVSYLVGACTGRSAGFSPLRMRIDVAGGAYRSRIRGRERALILQGVRNRQAGWRRFPGCACR